MSEYNPTPSDATAHQTAASRYGALETDRQMFLQRAREAAEYTIPALFPPQGHSSSTRYATPFQSLGARGVNNLSSKLLLALLPPESCFFKLQPDARIEAELEQNQDPQQADDSADLLDSALSQMEQTVLQEINSRKLRTKAAEAFKQLVVGGNTLVHMPAKKGMRVFKLDQYVVQRDPEGHVLEIVVKECVAPNTLPDPIKMAVLQQIAREEAEQGKTGSDKDHGDHKTVDLFTRVCREDKNWTVCQEVKGFKVPDSDGTYPLDKCPWLPLRWTSIDGENYGRGLCEEYIGDLASLEALAKMLVQAGMVAGKVIYMVKPNGSTRPESLNDKPNGAIIEGDPEDVKALQLEKGMDLQFVVTLSQAIEQRLSYVFLLNSAIQRDAERVTAEEIKTMAAELEDALGGVYSLFADEFQRPLAEIIMAQMQREKKLPELPKGTVSISVITGLDALGRNRDLTRLSQLMQAGGQALGPQVLSQYVNPGDYLTRVSAALGIKAKGLIKTDGEVQQAQQAAQQQQMAAQMAGPAMQAGAKMHATNTQAAMQQQQMRADQDQQQGNQ